MHLDKESNFLRIQFSYVEFFSERVFKIQLPSFLIIFFSIFFFFLRIFKTTGKYI